MDDFKSAFISEALSENTKGRGILDIALNSNWSEKWLIIAINYIKALTHFSSEFHFYTPWKRQKTKGGMEMERWTKLG